VDNDKTIEITSKTNSSKRKINILLKGGCDLSQIVIYLTYNNLNIIDEMNYVLPNNRVAHNEHTIILNNIAKYDSTVLEKTIKNLTFFDNNSMKTKAYDNNYDILVYSVLMDYTQEMYKNKETGILIPYGGYNNILNNPKGDMSDFIEDFKKNYIYVGQINKKTFINNLEFIKNKVHKPIIFINGSELGKEAPFEKGSIKRHIEMNAYLDEFIKNNENVLNIRK
jgi:hypothetical protein